MERLRHFAETALGVVLAVTPLALWIAWTPALLAGVMVVAAGSAGLLVLLTPPGQRGASMPALPSEFIDELHRLFPLTYHHSLHETPRFRKAMDRLSAMSRRTDAGNT